jgi:hypothetical protein
MVWEKDDTVSVAVSEPTWQNSGVLCVELEWAAQSVVSCDERITVECLAPSVKLKVDVSGRPNGAAFTAVLRK